MGVSEPHVDYAIRIQDLVKRFDGKAVLDGVSLDIKRGETMVIMGGSGSGKSTLLRTIIGSIRPDAGSIEMLGQDIAQLDEPSLNAGEKENRRLVSVRGAVQLHDVARKRGADARGAHRFAASDDRYHGQN